MSQQQRISLCILLILKLIIAALGASLRPMWLGHESDYFSVVRFLAENGRLPARSDFEGAQRDADIVQATQPPLFTYVALPIVVLLDDGAAVPPGFHPNVVCEGAAQIAYPYMLTPAYNLPPSGAPAAGYGLRLMNLLFALGMMFIVYRTVREVAADNHYTALVAAAFAGFQPQVFDLGIFISGESLLLLISSANLFFAVRLVRGSTIRAADLAGLIVMALLGPLTKTNGYALIMGTGAVLIYLVLYYLIARPRSHVTRLLLISIGILLVGIVMISIFNYARYGSVIGRYQNLLTIVVQRLNDINLINIVATLRDTYYDYVDVFPFTREKLVWLYTAGALAGTVLFLVSMVGAIFRRNRSRFGSDAVLLVYAIVAIALVLMRGNLVSDLTPDKAYAPVRYYVSGLPALAVMMAFGWQTLLPTRLPTTLTARLGEQRAHLYSKWVTWNWPGLLWALVWFAVVLWNVAQDVRQYPARQIVSSADLEILAARQDVTLMPPNPNLPPDVPHLRAYDYTAGDDGVLRLTAYLQVEETPALNYIARVVLSDREGSSSTCELIPHSGRYPVTRWEPNQIVTVPMDIPNCAAASDGLLSGPLNVTLEWLPANAAGEFVTLEVDTAQTISVNADLPRAQRCLANLGVFDDTFQVVKYTAPTSTTAGSTYLPAVNWYVRTDIGNNNLSRFYVVTHDESEQSYICKGTPRLGDHPISRWKRGEIIYFDQCALPIPPDAPRGEYTVSVGIIDNYTGNYLPITSDQGNVSPQGLLNVATLVVR